MTDLDGLHRHYRRLLWAYPNWYRRERGQEILTTLLDAAQPGQRRPTGRDVVDVLGQGIRCRLRPPRGPAYWILTLVVASFAALAGSAAAGGIAVVTLAPPPTEQQAIAIAEVAMAQRPDNIPGPTFRCPDYCNHRFGRGDQVVVFDDQPWRNSGLDHTTVMYWSGGPATMDRARARLVAGGWTIDDEPYPPGSLNSGYFGPPLEGFTARDGDLALHVHRVNGPAVFELTLEQSPPAALLAVMVTAAATGGLLAGWMMTTWVLHRYRRHGNLAKAAIVLSSLPPLMAVLLLELFTASYIVGMIKDTAPSMPIALLPAVIIGPVPLFATEGIPASRGIPQLIAIAAVLTIVVAALPLPPPRPRQPRAGHEATHPTQV
jgi:hypothetical protein